MTRVLLAGQLDGTDDGADRAQLHDPPLMTMSSSTTSGWRWATRSGPTTGWSGSGGGRRRPVALRRGAAGGRHRRGVRPLVLDRWPPVIFPRSSTCRTTSWPSGQRHGEVRAWCAGCGHGRRAGASALLPTGHEWINGMGVVCTRATRPRPERPGRPSTCRRPKSESRTTRSTDRHRRASFARRCRRVPVTGAGGRVEQSRGSSARASPVRRGGMFCGDPPGVVRSRTTTRRSS